MNETIDVTGGAPLIDVKQNAAGANVDREIIERIPKGRDFTSVVTSAPGITDETRNRGIQIDGASGADNRFMIDGVDTTNLLNGTSGKGVAPEFVQEVQVKASGYNAEYRAALGGVVSAITKSGGNQFHGDAGLLYHQRSAVWRRPPDAAPEPDRIRTWRSTSPRRRTTSRTWEPVVDLGGPILRDRLWFFAGYNRPVTATRRTVRFLDNGQTATFENRARRSHRQLERLQPAHAEPARQVRGVEPADHRRPDAARHRSRRHQPQQLDALPQQDAHRSVQRFVFRRVRLGREQPDLRQRHDHVFHLRLARGG